MLFQISFQSYIPALLIIFFCSISGCSKPEPEEETTQVDTSISEEKATSVSLTQAQYQIAGITLGKIENRSLSSNI